MRPRAPTTTEIADSRGSSQASGRHHSRSPLLVSMRSVSSCRALPPALSSPSRPPSSSICPGPGRAADATRKGIAWASSRRCSRDRSAACALFVDQTRDERGSGSTVDLAAGQSTMPPSTRPASRSGSCLGRAEHVRDVGQRTARERGELLVDALFGGSPNPRAVKTELTLRRVLLDTVGMLVPRACLSQVARSGQCDDGDRRHGLDPLGGSAPLPDSLRGLGRRRRRAPEWTQGTSSGAPSRLLAVARRSHVAWPAPIPRRRALR